MVFDLQVNPDSVFEKKSCQNNAIATKIGVHETYGQSYARLFQGASNIPSLDDKMLAKVGLA